MTASGLPKGQIVPAARPLGAFQQSSRRMVAEPAAPARIADPPSIRVVQQGERGDVQGFNQWEQLADALGPFSERLIKVGAIGAQAYADDQFLKGQNEILKAQVLANQQAEETRAQYSADGRKIAQKDPYAAVLMDRVNPFRQWGRENALSRIAASEIGPAVMQRYRDIPGVASLKPGDPTLKKAQADVVAEITGKYGLTADSRGFVEYVLPKIGQAQEKLYNQHQDDYTKNAKETAWRLAAGEVLGMYRAIRDAGVVEYEWKDEKGNPTVVRAEAGTAEYRLGIARLITRVSDRLAAETGIPGEASWLQRQMFEQIASIAGDVGAAELAAALMEAEYGAPTATGERPRVGDALGPQAAKLEYEAALTRVQRREMANNQRISQFEDELITAISGMQDGPGKKAAIAELMGKYSDMGVPTNDLLRSVESLSKTVESVDMMAIDTREADRFLSDLNQGYGTAGLDKKAAYQKLLNLIRYFPTDEQDKYMQRFGSVIQRRDAQRTSFPSDLINPVINNAIKANTARFYPNNITAAALRGANIEQLMAWKDADVAESTNRQLQAYRTHVYSVLQQAEAKKGGPLTPQEVSSITNQAVNSYGKNDKDAFSYLFPGGQGSGTPSVGQGQAGGGGAPAAPGAGAKGGASGSPAKAAPAPPTFPSGQLDRVPNRSQRLVDPSAPVLALPSVQEEIGRVSAGRPPSPQVIRAARDAKMSVGQWLLRQAGGYPNFKLPPEQRTKLLRTSAAAEGISQNVASAQAQSDPRNPLSRLASYGFRLFAPPANAAPAPPMMTASASRAMPNPLLSLIRSGEGGWDSVNRGTAGDSGPIRGLSQMTLGQVMQLQRSGVFAVGAYQFIPSTFKIAMKDAGLRPSDKFTPENQSKMATALMVGSKQPAIREYLMGRSDNLDAAHQAIAREWASLQGPSGRGAYDGDSAGNMAGIPAARVRKALIEARRLLSGK